MTSSKIKILVVDDSALMRKKISAMINQSPDCVVIGVAKDGEEALQRIKALKPDLVTLDLQLPKMDGLTCLKHIMKECPTHVLVLSAFSQEGSELAISALEQGAIDVVAKPSGEISIDIDKTHDELLRKIRFSVKIPLNKLKNHTRQKIRNTHTLSTNTIQKLIVVGASTGGPRAITHIMSSLPADLPATLLIIQHMPKYFIHSFANRLNQHSQWSVKVAEERDELMPGHAYIAPHGFDLLIKTKSFCQSPMTLHLNKNDTYFVSPSIDVTFISAAKAFGEKVMGVILTGMGQDGTKGALTIKTFGGVTLAEASSTSIVYGMPSSAIKAGAIDHVVPLDEMSSVILKEVVGDS